MSVSPFGNIKVALDTNILSYLLDNTYPNLNKFLKTLKDSGLVDLFCPQFVIYELIEIRKLEHYIRKVHNKTTAAGGMMNFSSVLKYRKDWSAAELDYGEIFEDIITLVEGDIQEIYDDYGIDYNDASIHKELWKPHQELVLSSKISKEDSLVLLSSVYPEIGKIEHYVVFLTNDEKFYKGYAGTGKDKIEKLNEVFTNNNIPQPTVLKINDIILPISKTKYDVIKDTKTDEEIRQFVNNFIFEHFQIKNAKFLLGNIIPCECKDKKDMFCFHLKADELNKEIYFSILTKELSVINIPRTSSNFWAYGEIKHYPYIPNQDERCRKISIKLLDDGGNSLLTEEKLNKIMVSENLVFIHPDTPKNDNVDESPPEEITQ